MRGNSPGKDRGKGPPDLPRGNGRVVQEAQLHVHSGRNKVPCYSRAVSIRSKTAVVVQPQ